MAKKKTAASKARNPSKSIHKSNAGAGAASPASGTDAALLADDYASWDPSKALLVVTSLLGHWPTLTAGERAELQSLSTDAQRTELGGRTKARGTAADACKWAASLDRQLTEHAVLREHYDPAGGGSEVAPPGSRGG